MTRDISRGARVGATHAENDPRFWMFLLLPVAIIAGGLLLFPNAFSKASRTFPW